MKKILLSILLMASLAITATAAEPCRVDTLLSLLNDGGQSSRVMICAHRGNWRGAPENSLQAMQQCIDAGIDIIEIDLGVTKDSAIVLMHDNTLDRTTTGSGKVSDHTLAQLRELRLLSPIGVKTRQKIPTLEELLELARGKVLIQVDKWQPCARQVMEIARRMGCERQLIFRGTRDSRYYDRNLRDLFAGAIYIPVLVCKGEGDNDRLDDYMTNIPSPVMSLSFTREDFDVLRRTPEIRKRGYRLWLNSLWDTFNAGHDDELAATDPENSYGWLLAMGGDIIFSDNPMLLDSWLKSIGRR